MRYEKLEFRKRDFKPISTQLLFDICNVELQIRWICNPLISIKSFSNQCILTIFKSAHQQSASLTPTLSKGEGAVAA
jgi:hypothetical protein